jgi:hypothetical protein
MFTPEITEFTEGVSGFAGLRTRLLIRDFISVFSVSSVVEGLHGREINV